MHESCKIICLQVGIPISRRKRLGLYFRFLHLAVKSLSESLSDRVRSITSRLAILQRPKLTDWRTDLAVRLNLQTKLLTSRLGGRDYNHVRLHKVRMSVHQGALCILFPAHFASYFRSAFLRSGFHSCPLWAHILCGFMTLATPTH